MIVTNKTNFHHLNSSDLPDQIKKYHQSNLPVFTSNSFEGLNRQIFLDVVVAFISAFDLIQLLLINKNHFSLTEDKKTFYWLMTNSNVPDSDTHSNILHSQLAWKLPELQTLGLEVMALHNSEFSKFGTYFTHLKKLTIYSQSFYKKDGNQYTGFRTKKPKNSCTKISGHFPSSLTSLKFQWAGPASFMDDSNFPTQKQICKLTEACVNLKEYQGHYLPDHCSNLTTLTLTQVWDEYDLTKFKDNQFLKELRLKSIFYQDLPDIIKQFPNIQQICSSESPSDIFYLGQRVDHHKNELQSLDISVGNQTFQSKALPQATHLQALILRSHNRPTPLNITEVNIRWLVEIFPNLTLLNLSCIKKIDTTAYAAIANLTFLKELNLSSYNNMPSEAFESIVTRCPLKALALTDGFAIQDQGFQLISKVTGLIYLNIRNSHKNSMINGLLLAHSSITALNLNLIGDLNINHLKQISKRFTNLTSLNIKCTSADLDPNLLQLIQQMPKLKQLGVSSYTRETLEPIFPNLKFT